MGWFRRIQGESQPAPERRRNAMSAADEVVKSVDSSMTSPEPGLKRQVMSYSKGIMLVRHKMEPGWVGAAHSHPHEQLIYVVSGAIQLTVGGVPHALSAGDSILVAGGIQHQARTDRATEVLDVFTPYRADYAAG
jgi:quercetin dioxygenase-like cupin family protein